MGKSRNVNPEIYKRDLILEYSEQKAISKAEAEERIEDVFGIVTDHLVADHDVKVNNFFNFFVRPRKAKQGKNPVTGEDMIIGATKTIVAKMTKPLKDRIQGKK